MTSRSKTRRHRLVAIAAALAASLVAVSSAGAANIECRPNVRVTNKKGASIKVLKFEYTVQGKAHNEGLANKKLAPNETENWPSQKLGYAATGIVVTSSRIQYKNDNSGAGDGYGPPVWSPSVTHTYTCNDSHNYIHVIE